MTVWNNDKTCCPSLPQPDGIGWETREDKWIPVMTKEAPAPEAIIQLVKCGCQKKSMPLPEIRLEMHNNDPCENACEDSETLKLEYDDSDDE